MARLPERVADRTTDRAGEATRPDRFGPFKVVEVLGQGPLTVVYRAVHESLGRTVAIKALRGTISPDSPLAAQLSREAQLLSRLHHRGVPTLYDFVSSEDGMWMAIEHVDGPSLAEVLGRTRGVELGAVVAILSQIAETLEYIHGEGIIHRDIKPANVLISRDGSVMLSDFGIAQAARLPSVIEPLDGVGGFGTPAYMSPEQVFGDDVDPRSDLFSLGVLAYEMLSGRAPFEGPDIRTVTQRIRHDPATPLRELLPEIPPPVERVIESCMVKDRERRIADAGLLRAELARLDHAIGFHPGPIDIVASLVRTGFVDAAALPSAAKPGHSSRERGVGRAAIAQLFVLAMMLGGATMIRTYVSDPAGLTNVGPREGEPLELLPDRAGMVRVVARPWASVFVDGQYFDVTPFARPIPLRPGKHQFLFRHPAAADVERMVTLKGNDAALVEVEMRVPPPPIPPPSSAPTSRTP